MKWFTCTPVDFSGGADFFTRDSGLLSQGFRDIGVDSIAVMPGSRRPDDEDGLLRCSPPQLRDPAWWSQYKLSGVVLYAWGKPSYAGIAEAIRRSGAKVILNQDSSGLVSPFSGFRSWISEQFILSGAPSSYSSMARAIAKIAKGLTYGIGMVDPGRARHFWAGNVIAAVTPDAAERYRSLCRWYGGSQLAERVRMIPHPVAKHFIASEEPKEERVICVGRWNDCVQKRPDRLAAVIPRILANRPNTKIDIVGSPGEFLRNWHQSLAKPMACRVILHGHIPSSKLARLMALARVGYCPSSFESFHIASGEALCAGASVVAGNSPSLPAFRWFAVNDSGALACSDTVESHADAVLAELAAWDRGERCAHTISAKWCPVLHAPEVAKRIIQLVDQHP